MAVDLMRTGPRGSSDQAPYLGPTTFNMVGPTTLFFLAKATGQIAVPLSTFYGCDWRVISVEVKVTTVLATNDIEVDLGVAGSAATLNSIVDGGVTGSATSALGTIVNIPLNGLASGTTFGITNGPLIATNVASGGTGAYSINVLAEPVSGPFFSNR